MVNDHQVECKECSIDPWETTIEEVADIVLHLFEQGNLKDGWTKGNRSAIASTLKETGITSNTEAYQPLLGLMASLYVDI